MYAVILRATVGELDQDYSNAIERMKKLAFEQYGCLEFYVMMDGSRRIAISYWETEQQIYEWKNNSEHLVAQDQARKNWYETYTVQVAEIKREYGFSRT